ncbi:BMP family ABC transporter substrate-binding protein [Devosia submarina]|uniref:BMP family ABC transporter substrate-binding protein n=1 Tax=Devosia submarina TaxID=1173082 RepID=UPI000D38CF4A|nr:BMP family ABC transporter substrate-binding protein [Devosia submarina]
MFDKWLDLEEQFNRGVISRRQLLANAVKFGMTTTAAYAFVGAVSHPRGVLANEVVGARAASGETLNAVMITIQRAGDLGPVDAMISGLNRGASELNYNVRVVEALQGEYQGALEASAAENPDLILGLFPPMADPLERAAKQFPDVYFANLVGIVPEGTPNLKSVWHKGQEGTYLAGALAGMISTEQLLGVESDTLGVVLAVENGEQHGYLAGYQQGFKATNANGQVIFNVIGGNAPFEDPVKAAQLAAVLRERGAGIIGTSGGKSQHGVLSAAGRSGYLALGMDNDQCPQYPDTCIASTLVHLDQWVYDVMNQVRTSSFTPGHNQVGLVEGAIDICPFADADHKLGSQLPKVIVDTIANMREQILSGEIKVSETPEL